ncbi:MAG TPA: MBL fold metallo-hydrolase, partial [Acidimicrobiales bacterium]|nr:MBL fold metallo-hydrolase [Acidimicrobiales bacterium]
MHVTGTLQREAWDAGLVPPVERVRPGLWSIPVPLPDSPLRYVLVYALELDSGVALIDAGWDTPEAWTALCTGLAVAGGTVADVRAVIVTHIHPDHYGLAGRVREASGAWVGLHPADAALLVGRYVDTDGLVASMADLLEVCGVPAGL